MRHHQLGRVRLVDGAQRHHAAARHLVARFGFNWEHEVAGRNREGQYILDPARVLKQAEPGAPAVMINVKPRPRDDGR